MEGFSTLGIFVFEHLHRPNFVFDLHLVLIDDEVCRCERSGDLSAIGAVAEMTILCPFGKQIGSIYGNGDTATETVARDAVLEL